MGYNVWEKGSQWRKWDLHVHTPASFHWKGSKLLRDMNADERDISFQELLSTIESSDVAVYGFMDYWTFDGYTQFNDFLNRKNIKVSKTIFPGMELRIEAPVDYRLNIHVLLSNLLTLQQLEDFKSKLMIASLDRRISDESIIEYAKSLDASKSKHHGFGDPKSLSPNQLLQLGSSTIEVTKESLREAVKSLPAGTVYIILPYDTSDGLLKLDWKTHPHADNYFMQTAHVFESRKDESVSLFLGVETDKNRDIIENFRKTLNYVKKPVVCGSDAHRYSDYGNYPNRKATWIKSDPTFQGFRQIIYEPQDRVRIQEIQPDEKTTYRVIDKVRYLDKANRKLFSSDWIHLNENLNSIVGGKSSGKSLLLYHIAKTTAPNLVEARKTEVPILDYSFGTSDEFDFEVVWKDGHCDKLSVPHESNVREIEYIPQLYVNALAEKQGKNSLYRLIESILEQNIDYREFIQDVNQKIANLEVAIDNDVSELLRKREELQTLYEERKVIGDFKAINEEINRLSSKITELRNDSKFTNDEEENYKKLLHLQAKERNNKRKYDELGNAVDSFVSTLAQIKKQTVQSLQNTNSLIGMDGFSKRVLSRLRSSSVNAISSTLDLLIGSNTAIVASSRRKAEKCAINEKAILEKLKPYSEKINDQTQLKSLETKLKEQEEILVKYNEKSTAAETVTEIGKQTRDELFENYSNLFGLYKSIVDKLRDGNYSKIDNDIVLETILSFDTERFSASFGDLFDRRRSSFKDLFGAAFSGNDDFYFNPDSHLQHISEIFKELSAKTSTDILFRKGIVPNDAIIQLFKNYFQIEYNIRYRNDEILDMSPGKRGLVLLQLILHISNATHPILIDQPEDNLDNRTISNELRQFVSAKKLTRQIIMVTHDANLVVLTDAENVIVSNQDGQQMNRENAEYRFEYVAGALENSFRLPDGEIAKGILYSCGIREHVCDVLEGGELAFKKREEKYGFSNR
jgi:hypothetical protein